MIIRITEPIRINRSIEPIGIITPIKITGIVPIIFYFLNKNLNFLLCNIK